MLEKDDWQLAYGHMLIDFGLKSLAIY